MFLFASVLCCFYDINCIDKKEGEEIQAIRAKEDAFFAENICSAPEGIDNPNPDAIACVRDQKEIIKEAEDSMDQRNKRDFIDLVNSNSFNNLNDFSWRKENEKGFTEGHSKIAFKAIQSNSENKVEVDGENGIDSEECGLSGNIPCKTIKKAVEHCKPEGMLQIHTTEDCNRFDIEPIIIDGRHIKLDNGDKSIISIKTALNEKKVKNGDALFCVKGKGFLYNGYADICVDTKRESGRNQGLIVVEGEGSQTKLENTNISNLETVNELSCVLIECKSGELMFQSVEISHFLSSNALIFAEASQLVDIQALTMDTISTKSESQSVITVTGGCQSAKFEDCKFSNCWSMEHRLGGAIYLEIRNSGHTCLFRKVYFSNCSSKSANANANANPQYLQLNDETKGGAIFIQAADEATGSLDLTFKNVLFSDCTADKGEIVYLSFPTGREQINEDQFYFEMEGIYGKQNYILLEDRKDIKIIDLMADKENILPYHSENIYVGGEKASNEKTCGRKEEPCTQLNGIAKHETWRNRMSLYIIGKVLVNEPFSGCQITFFSSMNDSFSMLLEASDQSRGTLRIGANLKAGKSSAVLGGKNTFYYFFHLDIEYPDAIEGDALSVLYGRNDVRIVDVVFRPWYTGLKGENVLGGEGKLLPYKLIEYERTSHKFSQLVIYGRNKNATQNSQRGSDETAKVLRAFRNVSNEEHLNQRNEENNLLCSWDSGLVFLSNANSIDINDSSFIGISDGVIFSSFCILNLYNCSFKNNHPIEADWEKHPSLQHNIRFDGREYKWIRVESLSVGSDGLDGKPFGMLSNVKATGTAAENMDSYFFSPILKNVTLKKEETSNKNERQDKNENEKEVEAVVHGSYLFPCELTFEVTKKKKGEEMRWTDCPVNEYVNETEMKVRIPPSLLEVDDYTSVVCRLTYPSGIINGEKKRTASAILVKQKKDNPNENNPKKLTRAQLIAIIVSVSAFAVVIVVMVSVTIICMVRFKKRMRYNEIKDINH
ncbi:uncharacterized protein MONOS_4376 [Monocercomonoides exilis]|uniref:uncharacterized protein n=1 Tax=Monocercomonoides exilis TaxID=2049356 RepID=UPI00355AB9A2|nr:hypothetical protein MONOS_4376 [Monocercomonoides exilis]|eukprot:MONOS_4376.1-p1 / transcript=MONOS_4376.1 / gene=MONOS_4376 / organism=Monocercomonoides_exilis_PA203 / gene_product=unspecified product / transcript_product=unspecified product / location=Mono_scaffold00115:94302-97304(-) / protein_length=1001 / sequence_SO=supercontig / SO=protein_coding / is_pseudo=false